MVITDQSFPTVFPKAQSPKGANSARPANPPHQTHDKIAVVWQPNCFPNHDEVKDAMKRINENMK